MTQHTLVPVPEREGLFYCTQCHCAEGTLTTHCPQVPVPYRVQKLVINGVVDYIGGGWNGVRFTSLNDRMQKVMGHVKNG